MNYGTIAKLYAYIFYGIFYWALITKLVGRKI